MVSYLQPWDIHWLSITSLLKICHKLCTSPMMGERKKKINGTGCHSITMDLNQYAVGRHDLHTFNTERLSFQLKVSTSCCRMPIQWTRSLPPKPHPPIPTIAKGLILTASQSSHLIFTAEYAGWKTKRPIWLALPRLERVGSKVKSCNAHYKEKLHTHTQIVGMQLTYILP